MTKRANGDGAFYEDKEKGRWVAAVSLPDGRRVKRTRKTEREAKAELRALLRARDRGELTARSKGTVDDYFDRWLKRKQGEVRDGTYHQYRTRLAHLRPLIGQKRLSRLNRVEIEAAYDALSAAGTLGPRSIRICHVVLSMALKDAVITEELGKNPAQWAKTPRVERKPGNALRIEEVATLLDTSGGTRWHALWVLLVTTGMRPGEALGLRWDDWDEMRHLITIARQARRMHGGGVDLDAPCKTESSYRTVPVTTGLAEALERHHVMLEAEWHAAGPAWEEHDLIFSQPDGRATHHSQVHAAWRATLDAAGVRTVQVRDLRRTAATILQEIGVSQESVKQLLGHSAIATTSDIYTGFSERMQASLAHQLDRAIRDARSA